MSDAYLIGHISIRDPEKWAAYRDRVPATLEPWGGDIVFRGRLAEVLSGEHPHTDTVVIRFPSMDNLNRWHESAAYQALIPLRQEAADVDLLAFEE